MKKNKFLSGLIIASSITLLVNTVFYLGIFEEMELKTFDMRARYFNKGKHPSDDIAVILIDEASLRVMNPLVGRWPWPRSVHADVLDFLALSGAKAVLFDILFTENERIPGASPNTNGPNDIRLSEATQSTGNVYHAVQLLIDTEDEYNKGLLGKPLPADFVGLFSLERLEGIKTESNNNYYLPFPELYRASKGIGVVEFSPDRDGIYRRTKLLRHYQGSSYPALSIASLIDILKPELIKQERDSLILKNLKLKTQNSTLNTLTIPLQKDGSYHINMYDNFKPYSMSGILASVQKIKTGELEGLPVSPDEFKNKVVFIGASAVGVEDLKPTSLGGKIPGVYLHASIYSNIVNNDFLISTSPLLISFSILVFSFIITFTILWVHKTIYQIGIVLLLTFLYISIALYLFKNNIVYDMVAPSVSIVLSWMGAFAYLSFTEGKDKRKIKKMLGQYVSSAVLSTIVEKSKEDVLRAEIGNKENMTILFTDIRDFTSISESLEAKKVVEMLNGYLSGMVDVIFKHEGTLDKFIGDSVMAFWGAPIKINDHGKRAVKAAIEMVHWLESFNKSLAEKGLSRISAGIGINTGDVILGNIGSEKKLDYTVIGDSVNLASRIEGLTRKYDCPILLSEYTYSAVRDGIICSVVDIVRVKGKQVPIKIYRPIATAEDSQQIFIEAEEIARATEEAFGFYLVRKWQKAIEHYERLNQNNINRLFISRCKTYLKEEPPPEWDGVVTFREK